MDPRNGEILAMVSRPSFDPNEFAVRINRKDWNKLINDPDHPLMNKALQAQLAPGSTFKIMMSVAGLQEGIAQDLKVTCSGGWGPYGFYHHCDEHHGAVNIYNAIPFSCDTYFYQLGDKLGIDRIAKYATAFGYGQRTGIDLPGEQPGLMPSAQWKMKNYHDRWRADETLDIAIGQGAVEATPIQLARIIGGIASGGHLVRPHSVFPDELTPDFRKGLIENFPGSGEVDVPIDPENWQIVTDGMYQVTQPGQFHTAGGEHLEGIDFGGKTGTAQVMSHAALDKTSKGRITEPNVWFVGVTPTKSPELVVAVLYQNGNKSWFAARIGAKVVSAYVEKQRRLMGNLPAAKVVAPAEMGAMWTAPGGGAGKAIGQQGAQAADTQQGHLETGRFLVQNGEILKATAQKTQTGSLPRQSSEVASASAGLPSLTSPSAARPASVPAPPKAKGTATKPDAIKLDALKPADPRKGQ
jgi:penicillin-binding protein 2